MSSSVFDALVRQAPEYASHGQALLAAVSDDLARLREKYATCSMLQSFLEGKQSRNLLQHQCMAD